MTMNAPSTHDPAMAQGPRSITSTVSDRHTGECWAAFAPTQLASDYRAVPLTSVVSPTAGSETLFENLTPDAWFIDDLPSIPLARRSSKNDAGMRGHGETGR